MGILSFLHFLENVPGPNFHKVAITFNCASKLKTKGTLFYEALNIGWNKVPLFFHLEVI